jgi:hypothetical protein
MNEPQKIVLELKLAENPEFKTPEQAAVQAQSCCGAGANAGNRVESFAFEAAGNILVVRPFCKYQGTSNWLVKTRLVGFAPKHPLYGWPDRICVRVYDNITNIQDAPEACPN